MTEDEQERSVVIEEILKTRTNINPTEIAKACKKPRNFVAITVIGSMPCLSLDGRGEMRGSRAGSHLYGVVEEAINPDLDPDSEETSCCNDCSNADELCKPEWREWPADETEE